MPPVAKGMSLRDIEKSFFDLYWHLDPVAATQAGVAGHDDRYGRFSDPERTPQLNEVRVMLFRFEKLKPQAKNPQFWLSHLLGGLHHLLLSADSTPAEK